MEAENPSENPINSTLIKGLASTNASIRSKNLKIVLDWLPTQTLISDDDLKRLWKSLFYCMWHCDKIQNQTHLINRLSNLIPILPPSLSISYFSHFIVTMRREWPGIDHLRLDKFYLFVRYFVRNMFNLLKKVKWDLGILEEFVGVLDKNLFFFVDDNDVNVGVKGLGNGVSYHFVSVFCDEIKPFLPLSLDVLNLLFRPFFGILGKSDNRVLVVKVRSHVFDLLLKHEKSLLESKKSSVEVNESDEMVLFGTVALVMGFSTRLFELGSSEDCLQSNRKVVFALHEEFSRLEKEKASLGVEIALPEVTVGDDDDEVPKLVPIAGEIGIVENGGKQDADTKTKNKKSKKKNVKKSKESKEESVDKKSKKTEKNVGSDLSGDTEMVTVGGDCSNVEPENDVNDLIMNEEVISNLQKQFEKIAAESGLEGDGASAIESPSVRANGKVKKRKRSKSVANSDVGGGKDEDVEETAPNTDGASVKRVRFAMKNNLVWKPHSPLPPQSVRIPPSSTPRGSALKKGVSPGPVRDVTQDVKKAKKKRKPSPLKKARKVKSLSPAVKHGKKVKPMSA
ncbi:hypothetical protein RND81_07G085900 [Saponaria officinalis]|uniref:Uncharacterized protein n=1 Tax=Saponaria officinalis TaxID=3572 RepID=A0AAW1JN90_SAPOF